VGGRPTAIIMVGATGSGKSGWIRENHPDTVTICQDDYYYDSDGNYEFEKEKTAPAIRSMMCEFIEHMQGVHGIHGDDIIIDSKNVSDAEIAPWILVAQAHDYIVRIVAMDTPPRVSAERNKRGLSESVITGQHSRMLRMLESWPRWWPKPKIIKREIVNL
jgi:predicted kinase